MTSELGAKIGEGAFAEVFAWAPGQVVKLFRAGFPQRGVRHEARVTRAVNMAGAPSAEVFEELTLQDRSGFVMSRLEGPTLLQLSRSGQIAHHETGAILADLASAVHQVPPPSEVPTLQIYLRAALTRSPESVPADLHPGLRAYIDQLPSGETLCHADLHPGNVIMTSEGPRLVGWGGAVCAPGTYDLALCQVLLGELIPRLVDDPDRPLSVNAAIQSGYAQTAGLSLHALTEAASPFLPAVRLHALLSGAWPGQKAHLMRQIEAMASQTPSDGG